MNETFIVEQPELSVYTIIKLIHILNENFCFF